jgi:2-amino-4-hydroxy-6-hydroxymethyldihydropteridine diphosphokinase
LSVHEFSGLPTRAYIGIGSNLEDPKDQVILAITQIDELDNAVVTAHSSLYQTAPVGPEGQPDYINAVVQIDTYLSASDLLTELQNIENNHGRTREVRWGARTLDLDILLFGEEQLCDDRLQVPHPRMMERNFVIVPLAEVAPDYIFANGERIEDIKQRLGFDGIRPANETSTRTA